MKPFSPQVRRKDTNDESKSPLSQPRHSPAGGPRGPPGDLGAHGCPALALTRRPVSPDHARILDSPAEGVRSLTLIRTRFALRMAVESLPWTGDPDADRLLAENPFALLMGMLLDQQFPMERAFYGPFLLERRLGEPLDPRQIAEMDPLDLAPMFRGPPAIHRFPGAFASEPTTWRGSSSSAMTVTPPESGRRQTAGPSSYRRLRELPGFGDAKARIFVGVLGKRLGLGPPGWEAVAADWPSIADVGEWEDVFTLRQQKRELKASQKS